MDSGHIAYIQARMNELGYENFHLEPLSLEIKAGETLHQVKAYNEYLYLLNGELPNGTLIHSDTFILSAQNLAGAIHVPYEFSGHVLIFSGNTQDFHLNFIRATPH